MTNESSPFSGGFSMIVNRVTLAEDGPRRSQSAILSRDSLSPWAWTSTDPSGRFRTHPVSPRERAVLAVQWRNPTPCTLPSTRK